MQTPYPVEPVLIVLSDGKERHMRLTLRTIRNMKQALGGGDSSALRAEDLAKLASLEFMPTVISAALVDDTLTPEQVEELFDIRAVEHVAQAITALVSGTAGSDRPTEAPETEPNPAT
jgi:hypothetical protein